MRVRATEWAWVRHWRRHMDLVHVLWQARASVAVLLIGATLLLGVDQMRELLTRTVSATDRALPRDFAIQASLAGAALIWALATWFFSRSLLRFRFGHTPAWTESLERYAQAVPRWLGFLVLLTVAAAMGRAGIVAKAEHGAGTLRLVVLAATYAILAALFWTYVLQRGASRKLSGGILTPYYFASRDGYALSFRSPLKSPEGEFRRWILLSALATAYLFPLVSFGTTAVSSWWTAPTIFVLALSQWSVFLSLSTYVWERYRAPVTLALALLVALWSMVPGADNHRLRTLNAEPGERASPETRAADWLQANAAAIAASDTYPVYIVAAAGGGVRAAYWSAGTLARFQDRDPNFAAHVFAISGVSGGALGATIFAAQVAGDAPGAVGGAPGGLAGQAKTMLRHDFLSPVAITLLYPDLLNQIVPIHWALPAGLTDRATTLEKAWENAWKEATGNDRLSRGYGELQAARARRPIPYLALVGTVVETGLPVTAGDFDFGTDIGTSPMARDVMGITGRDIALSTAAHLSARFTYVSPAATLADKQGRSVMHVVDGGYFENGGHHIALEITRGLARCIDGLEPRCKEASALTRKLRPILISLTNDPGYAARLTDSEPRPKHFLSELFSPLSALLESREGRGVAAEQAAQRFFIERCWETVAVRAQVRGVTLPLGWSLAANAANNLDLQLDLATAVPMPPAPRSACRTQSP